MTFIVPLLISSCVAPRQYVSRPMMQHLRARYAFDGIDCLRKGPVRGFVVIVKEYSGVLLVGRRMGGGVKCPVQCRGV